MGMGELIGWAYWLFPARTLNFRFVTAAGRSTSTYFSLFWKAKL